MKRKHAKASTQKTQNTVLIRTLLLLTSRIVVWILIGYSFWYLINRQLTTLHPQITITDAGSMEHAIEEYLVKTNENSYFRSPASMFFCAARVVWKKEFSQNETIAYAKNECASVVLLDGDLRGESGGGSFPLFKLTKKGDRWFVIDADERTVSEKQPITQGWVKEADRLVPDAIKNSCFSENCFSTDGVIKKAAKYFRVTLPSYPLHSCVRDADCADTSVCVLRGDTTNTGPNTCVKRCATNSDCGIAHTCRYQCVGGENGCSDTAQKICIPDILYPDVKKDPNSFVGFDDFEIHRRRAIEETYPDFGIEYEKQPCFAGCSVEVIEESRDYYYAFIAHGSGVPIVRATCLRVDPMMKVHMIGTFPKSTDTHIGYREIDPKTCTGIK